MKIDHIEETKNGEVEEDYYLLYRKNRNGYLNFSIKELSELKKLLNQMENI